jgi:hypothetical protein
MPFFIFQQPVCASPAQARILLLLVMFAAGLVHLVVMWTDIIKVIAEHPEIIGKDRQYGLVELLKDAPRVGRRYLSLTMVQMLISSMALLLVGETGQVRWMRWALKGAALIAAISLFVLDARSAYVSILIAAAIVLGVSSDRAKIGLVTRELLPSRSSVAALIVFLILALALAYSAGMSRWNEFRYSVEIAVTDVLSSRAPLASRPYVSLAFWDKDVADIETCRRARDTRCVVDQSAYLRLAWLLEGIGSLFVHPAGIGYSADYMGRYWNVANDPNKYQSQDSFFTLVAVCFGWPGVLSIVWMLLWLVAKVRIMSLDKENAGEFTVIFLAITIIIRMTYDQVTDGLWCYLLMLIGSASMPATGEYSRSEATNGRL